MAQVKKEIVKNKILEASLILFAKRGYKETSISDIANMAEISVGNVYRYYKSKIEILKDAVPEEFVKYAKKMITHKMLAGKSDNIFKQLDSETYQNNSAQFLKEVMQNRMRILAFIKCNEEETYVQYKKEFLDCMVQSFLEGFIDDPKERELKRELVTLLYRGVVSLFVEILTRDCSEEEMIKEISIIIRYHVFGLSSLV